MVRNTNITLSSQGFKLGRKWTLKSEDVFSSNMESSGKSSLPSLQQQQQKLNKMNISGFSWIHERNEVMGLDVMQKSGETGEFGESKLRSAYLKLKINRYEHLNADSDKC